MCRRIFIKILMKFSKLFFLYIFLILVVSCSSKPDTESAATWQPEETAKIKIAADTLTITKGKIIPFVETSGVVSGKNEAMVLSETVGTLEEVLFRLGDKVKKGQVLVRVDDSIPRLRLEQVRQDYENARDTLELRQKLLKQGNASQFEVNSARSIVSGFLANLRQAQKNVDDCYVKAPISGFIGIKPESVTRGNQISRGTIITKIIDTSGFQVEVSVGEREVSLIRPGAKAEVIPSLTLDNKKWGAMVRAVAAGSDPGTGSYGILLDLLDTDMSVIRSGIAVKVLIETNNSEEEIIIPGQAVVNRQNKQFVFLAKNGVATPVEVQIIKQFADRLTVKDGLQVNDDLIVSGIASLKPGTQVQINKIGRSGDY